MRLQIFIVMVLLSLIMWVASFDGALDVYRASERAGLVRNHHIMARVAHVL